MKNKKCVCSLIDKIGVYFGSNLEGEIYFKHSAKCRFRKTTGTYEWIGGGFKEIKDHESN